MRRPLTWLIAIGVVVFLGAVVAPFVYINFIRDDPPDPLTFEDIEATTTTVSGEQATETTAGAASGEADLDGTYAVAPGSVAGYRATEILFGQDAEAVGRTNDVTGQLALTGTTVDAASFEVDLTTLESDEDRRDNQVQGRILETAQFPTATFELTEPIVLAALPADLEEIAVPVTGAFTIHGVTKPVTFDVLARRNGANIEVNGSVEITWADYEIDDPSGGPASVQDSGDIEFVLVFEKEA